MELLAFLSSIRYWKKIRNTHWKWFSLFLLFIVLAEFAGRYFTSHNMDNANHQFYNYFEIPMEFTFFFWLFYKTFSNTKIKWLPIVCAIVYLVSWLMDILYFSQHHFFFYSFSYTIGNLLLLVLTLRFFMQLVTSDAILTFRKNMMFWVSSGLMLFYLGTFPYYGLRNTIAYNYIDIYTTYSYIVCILDSFMYLMFIFSFVWGKPNIKSSSF